MLEQEVSKQEAVEAENRQMPLPQKQENDLFRHFEVNNGSFAIPSFSKILAISVGINFLAFAILAQTNLITKKGCESPLVGQVCEVLDMVYVGSKILGNDSEWVSKDYEKTEIENAEIAYLDVTAMDKPLAYPEGYFALANPEETAARLAAMNQTGTDSAFVMPPSGSIPFPGIPNQPSIAGDPMNQIPVLPPKNNNSVIGDLPDSPIGNNPIGKPSRNTSNFPKYKAPRPPKIPRNNPMTNESPKDLLDDQTTAKNDPKQTPTPEKQPGIEIMPVAEDIINKKPLQEFGDNVLDKVTAKTLDLNKPFMVVMQGALTDKGKFDKNSSKYVRTDGDTEMVNVAKSAIEAIGDSGILTYLTNLGVKNVNFTLVQDDNQIYAIITSDQKSENKAKSTSSSLNSFISIGKLTIKEEDTLALLNAAKVESKGNNFILNFKIDKPVAQELIKRQLDKAQAKRQQQPQPNGITDSKNSNLNAVKK